jgi:hypothetical protein
MARRIAQGKPQQGDFPETEYSAQTPQFELDASLQDFLLENANGAGYQCKIFRSYKTLNNKEQCSYLTEFQDTVPSYEVLRNLLGPGVYRINVVYTDKKGDRQYTARHVELDSDPLARNQPGQAQLPVAIAAQPTGLSAGDMLALITQLIKSMGEMAKTGNGKSAASELGEIAGVFAHSLGAMANQQVAIMGTMQRQLLDLPDQEPAEKRPEGLVDLLVWAWNTFGQKLIQNPALGKMFAPQVQTMPQVQYLINNPAEYQRVLNEFVEQEGVNPDSLAALLGALDMPTPEQLAAAAVPQPAQP